jgi:16S rRNA C967 or C1407 C5-methylase (RsmB/RsmF family)/predicted ribosome-associated RNA-binding protein Tma20
MTTIATDKKEKVNGINGRWRKKKDCGGIHGDGDGPNMNLQLAAHVASSTNEEQAEASSSPSSEACFLQVDGGPTILPLDHGEAEDSAADDGDNDGNEEYADDDNGDDDDDDNIGDRRPYRICLSSEMMAHLEDQHSGDGCCEVGGPDDMNNNDDITRRQFRFFLNVMTRPPAVTICRINKICVDNRRDVMSKLLKILNEIVVSVGDQSQQQQQPDQQQNLWELKEDPIFDDVIQIIPLLPRRRHRPIGAVNIYKKIRKPWYSNSSDVDGSFPSKIVLVDRFCGEAVLRGSDIFVKGVLAASPGLWPNDRVAVYADLPVVGAATNDAVASEPPPPPPPRGLVLRPIDIVGQKNKRKRQSDISSSEHQQQQNNEPHLPPATSSSSSSSQPLSYRGTCVYLGVGTVKLPRKDIFSLSRGVAVTMSVNPTERSFQLVLPPLHDVLPKEMMLQNLPSVVVAHTLDPQPHEVILDMCAAPGGKTSHLASLVNNNAFIVACDKSRKKILTAQETFKLFGATCIIPLALDTTKCLSAMEDDVDGTSGGSAVRRIFDEAPLNPDDGLKEVKYFPPCSFDRILLDPPCSALGLRPKLMIQQSTTVINLKRHALYQQRFVDVAVRLLKPGGYMTYSTCTVTSDENERMVSYILQKYGDTMELMPIPFSNSIGGPGLACGLSDEQRHKVRRFGGATTPSTTAFGDDDDAQYDDNNQCHTSSHCAAYSDTMGFFLALFRKKDGHH